MANSRMLRAITNRSPFFFFFSKTLINPSPSFSLLSSFPFSSRRKSNSSNSSDVAKREADDGEVLSFVYNRDPNSPPNLFVVQPRLRPDSLFQSKLNEALNLANSLEEQRDGFYQEDFDSKKMPPHLVVQNPSSRSVKSDTYFGPGTVDNIKCHLRALESQGRLDAVFVNAILSGIQQRNLEMAWGKPVLDRVGLIIEIFHAHAETKEAKLQSELAALMYKKSRLVRVRGPGGRLTFGTGGEAQVVSARGRGSGGRGFIGGAGETELQLQRRRNGEPIYYHKLKKFAELVLSSVLLGKGMAVHMVKGLATVAVVGYTNAGKSTLVSALSESDLYSENRLFATVDPRLRSVILPSGRKVLLSDTVGFISDLPVQLVEAFHATLEEVVEADLLVHVLDASAPDLDLQRTTVLEVLQQIGVSEEKIQNMIEVWNKIDLLNKDIGVDEEHDEFLSGNKENEETVSGEEYVCGVEGEDETFSEEDETFSGGDCLDGDEKEDGSFASDQEECDIASDLSSEEAMESFKIRQALSFKQQGIDLDTSCEAKAGEHVETSAAMRVGLQELLNVIDEKLSSENSVVTRRVGPFDRKWRPSCTEDTEKAA